MRPPLAQVPASPENRQADTGSRSCGPLIQNASAVATDGPEERGWLRYRIPADNAEAARLLEEIRQNRDAVIEVLRTIVPSPPVELPTRRCRTCNSWLFWVSVHGVVACSTCHRPANPDLVRTWHWLAEGECEKTQ
jgi:hypothetical protein